MQHSMQGSWSSSMLAAGNAAYLEQQFENFLADPTQVDPSLRQYFEQLPKVNGGSPDLRHSEIRAMFRGLNSHSKASIAPTHDYAHEIKQSNVHDLINGYRLLGHLLSDIDPLDMREKLPVPELRLQYYDLSNQDHDISFDAGTLAGDQQRTLKEIIEDCEAIYCGSIGSEYMHIPDSTERLWLQEQVERRFRSFHLENITKEHILERLTAAEGLEKYLGRKYPGAKRFGLEGCDSLIVSMDRLLSLGGEKGVDEVVIGMAHRGRLNVLVNILGKMPGELFDEFEGKHSLEVESGDVKYHQGFSSDIRMGENNIHLSLAFNPSHLEIVTPVMCGSVRARQERRGKAAGRQQVLPIAIHGDAAFAGQGVVMETLNMSQTRGYNIGGTIHLIINNQVGFTTSHPRDARSTLYCSDLGKMIQAPIFHVNANDPEAVYVATELALAYRIMFNKDVIIDLMGYRRHGHNEADEPAATQPDMYKIIKKMPTARKIYADQLIGEKVITSEQAEQIDKSYRKSLDEKERSVARNLISDWKSEYATDWTSFDVKDWRVPVETKVPLEELERIANLRDTVPDGFKVHSRIKKLLDDRRKMTKGELALDWGYAETLAYGTLLEQGTHVRLSGQDCGRGTFFHRHAAWHCQDTGDAHISLCNLSDTQARFKVINSLLSEMAVLGYEYGFSTSEPCALVIWEAQFGDFANGAQVVIDQFISSGEQKWGRLSGLTMFLPHGYEGQGPEHSSARLERYLQLCAQYNIQVCIPSTPAQIFHLLRRQILRPLRKPLIVITPKSLLRHKLAVSSMQDLAQGGFQLLIPDRDIQAANVDRIVLCSGKVYYDLLEKRETENLNNVAIIRVEQLYPFPEIELKAMLSHYPKDSTVVWCQEEPQNQGAWYSSQHHFRACLDEKQTLNYAGREATAAPAAGYLHLHQQQQQQLVADALGL